MYCMRYHQSPQLKHSDRISVLDKIEDKFNYGDMTFPASFEDIQKFEEDNKITINIYRMKGEIEIVRQQAGDVGHCRNGMINLLYVQDEEGEQGHYIYISRN